MIRFVDLFAGIGGIRKGLELALSENGISSRCVFSSEINPKACETYLLNFGHAPTGDIRQVECLPEHDVLLAGFPCQAFSYAGKQRGFGDTRGTLFFEIERLIARSEVKPKILLLENVRGFTTHDQGRTFQTVKNHLQALGYSVNALVLNSSNFGVPQNRVRVYLVCVREEPVRLSILSDLGAADSHKFKDKAKQSDLFGDEYRKYSVVSDILEQSPDPSFNCTERFVEQLKLALGSDNFSLLHGVRMIDYRGGNSIHSWDMGTKGHCSPDERDLMNCIISNRRRSVFGKHQDGKRLSIEDLRTIWDKPNLEDLVNSLNQKGYIKQVDGKYNPVCGNMSFEVFKFLDPESISITIVSSDAHRLGIVQNGTPRRITPRECARMQGFPDEFKLHPQAKFAYYQLGNSVTVPVIREIFLDLIAHGHFADF